MSNTVEREQRQFFAIHQLKVQEVTGFICSDDGYWWIPELGYSMMQGVSLFENRLEALGRLRMELRKSLHDLTEKLTNLEKEFS